MSHSPKIWIWISATSSNLWRPSNLNALSYWTRVLPRRSITWTDKNTVIWSAVTFCTKPSQSKSIASLRQSLTYVPKNCFLVFLSLNCIDSSSKSTSFCDLDILNTQRRSLDSTWKNVAWSSQTQSSAKASGSRTWRTTRRPSGFVRWSKRTVSWSKRYGRTRGTCLCALGWEKEQNMTQSLGCCCWVGSRIRTSWSRLWQA